MATISTRCDLVRKGTLLTVTPIPAPMRTATSDLKTSSAGAPYGLPSASFPFQNYEHRDDSPIDPELRHTQANTARVHLDKIPSTPNILLTQ